MNEILPRVSDWRPELIGLHVLSDALIAVAYFAILGSLIYTAQRRGRAPRLHWMGLLFVLFIVISALMHFLNVWTLWLPDPWLEGAVKAATAVVSLAVAFLLIPNLPRVLALKSPVELERMNRELAQATERLARREQQLADALDIACLGAWDLDLTNDRLKWSDQMYLNYGLEPGGESPGLAWLRERIHPQDRERAEEGFAAALAGEDEFGLEYRIVWEDGSLHYIHYRGRVVRNDAGEPVRAYGTSQDVTVQQLARAEAERREAALAEAQAIAHFGSWEWDVRADRVDWSDELHRIYGYEPGGLEVTFSRYLEHVHPDDRDRVAGTIGGALESAGTFEFEERILRPDGSERVLESKGYVVTEGGQAVRMVGTCHDVTEAREAEAARRESEDRFRRIVETAQEGIWTIDEGGVTTYVNDRLAMMLGYRPDEMVGRSLYDFMDDDAREEATRNMERRRQGIGERHEFRLRTRSGEDLWTYMATSPLMAEDGAFLGALAMVMDITDLREAERSVRVLARAGEILGTSLEPGVTIQQIADLVVEEAADGCFVDLLDASGRIERAAWSSSTLELNELSALPRLAPSEAGTAHPIVQVMTRGQSIHVPRVDDDWLKSIAISDSHFELLRQMGLSSFLAVPVSARGRILGALLCLRAGAAARAFTESDLRLLKEVGRRTGVALDNARLFEALSDSEQRYRMLADYSSDMILRFTPEGVCTYASPASLIVTGFEPAEMVGKNAAEFIHEEDLEAVAESRRKLLTSVGPHSVMCRLLRKSGGWIWAESTGQGVWDAGAGRVETLVTVVRDVTEAVRAARTIRLLEQVAVAANEAVSVPAAMQAALRLVCDYTDWPAGHVYVPQRTPRGDIAPTDIWHLDQPDKLQEFRELTEATRFQSGEGLPGRVLETGRPAWVEDVNDRSSLTRAAALRSAGIRSAYAFPVRAGSETLAVLEFFSTEPGRAEPELLDVMDNVGTQLGQVLQRQRTEAALRASEQQFRALAESAVEAIVTADAENRITYCNDSSTRLFGWRAEELVGQSLTVLMPERLRDAHLAAFERFVETREATIIGRPVELVGARKDGEEFPIELSLAWWEGSDGLHFAGIIRDITERKKAEESLREKMEELARSNAELGLFTYVASHDLREPLRTVGSNLQLVVRRLGPEMEGGVRRSIDYALGGVRRMQGLIDDLLIYSRVGTEGKPFMPLDAGQALAEAQASLKVAIEESAADFEVGPLPRVLGDQSQIVQLFQNLISNAIKFRRDGVPPRVRVDATRAGLMWEFSIEDNGIGIDPAYAEHVFTIFQRLQSDDRYPGTGIGLAVCRKIVERHGGRIWVESAAGEGATLRFTLPAVRR